MESNNPGLNSQPRLSRLPFHAQDLGPIGRVPGATSFRPSVGTFSYSDNHHPSLCQNGASTSTYHLDLSA